MTDLVNDRSTVTDAILPSQVLFGAYGRFLCNEGRFSCDQVTIWMCFVCHLAKQHSVWNVKTLNFRISVSPGSAEALVRWGEKIKYHLTAYFLSNISAKNCQNRSLYVGVVASQNNDFFGTKLFKLHISTIDEVKVEYTCLAFVSFCSTDL